MTQWPESIAKALNRIGAPVKPAAEASAWIATITLPGKSAYAAWHKLAEACRDNGYWPVILGSDEEVGRLIESSDERADDSVDDIIAAADAINLDAFLLRENDEDEAEHDVEPGDWPEVGEIGKQSAPAAVADFDGTPHPHVTIAIFEADKSWKVLARLDYGAWNDCPSADAQVARHRDWHKRFGSDLCAITSSTIECFVARPPQSREESLELAKEQYFYCYDIVEQGTGSIAALAAGLQDSPLWFFWWD